MTQQKALYLRSLRQLVEDEVSIDGDLSDKAACRRELLSVVDEISTNITDLFTMRRVQEFHHSHYQYY